MVDFNFLTLILNYVPNLIRFKMNHSISDINADESNQMRQIDTLNNLVQILNL